MSATARPAEATATFTLTIDGKQVCAERGQTILEAARAAGIGIPTLCHHGTVEAYGACRLCIVDIEVRGRTRLVTSCNYEAAEGLMVRTASERVLKSRRMTIELLLARCPEVESLRTLAKAHGVKDPRFPREKEDCILCGLCVRVCRERMGVGAADFVGRGAGMRVDTPYERHSEVCITCGACTFVCPTHSKRLSSVFPEKLLPKLSEFDMGMRPRSTIYIPFPQALPNTPVIDRENCVHFANGACGTCREVCPAKAIDYDQADATVKVDAGAVILSPGFCAFDPREKPELSYGLAPNVLSSLQFERLLSASGPFMGNVVRPSDGKVPKRIAFVQCVGSRDSSRHWCSSVCCMYALKEAMIAKEHEHGVECTLFYMDIRAHGKGFDAYYDRARAQGVRFIRSRPARIEELGGSGSLRVGYIAEEGDFRSEDFDMVVLSSGLNPPKEAAALAERFGITLDENGFAATRSLDPAAASRPGVFLCGPFSEPKDIPETVVEASSAAADAMVLLAESRGKLVTKVELPAERNVAGEPPRIGVFVCHCGKNIGGYVDVPAVRDYAKSLPDVAFAMDNLYTCSSDAQTIIKDRIREHRLNRVVVASCSPRTHEPLFQQTIRETGLNIHLFEMANIRDQDSWVHMDHRREATDKAMDLVRMAVAKARLTEPLGSIPLPVTHAALVVGGGLAGMTAALTMADQGFEVFLVEKSRRLGGTAALVPRTITGEALSDHVKKLVKRVSTHPKISAFISARLEKVEGFVGNFQTTIRRGAGTPVVVEHGAAILAVGARQSEPTEYQYGSSPNVVTLLELEKRLASPAFEIPAAVVMIQCVGSREDGHAYCSRLCCASSVKQAIRIKTAKPDANVIVLFREMRTYGLRERFYEQAREMGVSFIRYDVARKPATRVRKDGRILVTAFDAILGAQITVPADLLVLASRIDPNPENEALSQLFKVPLSSTRFFLEAHAKLRPVDFATDGVYVCGAAHYPKDSSESIAQAKAAAGRAVTVLSRDTIEAEGKVSFVRESRCVACGACVGVCPYRAIEIDASRNAAKINDAVCKGCGVCAATCRSSAIDLKGFRDEQILAVLRTVMEDGVAADGVTT
ncbi:MAG TPA: 2Fe-2S iron-sulfur cluster-binding protein [Spirochaetia bacterium]|nr:2Fe-2S iron-sulfur cluster-binding protein [Spirochaetia bacterium]